MRISRNNCLQYETIAPFISLIIYSFLLSSCIAKTVEKPESKNAIIAEKKPALDSSRFDIKKFEANAYKQKLFKENFKKPGFDAQYEEELTDDRTVRQWTVFPEQEKEDTQEYAEEITKKWNPFVIRKKYDYKGQLRRWSTTFRQESINKSYEYDESGKIIKITNYEEKFKHSFADIREFLLKAKGIDIYDTRQAIARRVNHRYEDPTQVYYDIYVLDKKDEKNDYRIVMFDDTLQIKEYRNENKSK
ncbi:hypothetical protein [Chryseobacterium indoltheticum]|uniref:Lipoprotein n=1 Tax=Chryseobacterium indoltheticum TaxID=254 RepID=A0A3G6N0X6_9FLAO|nr:hypothetical protein [Chryseobacterium indoltheticum]AZA61650.1 hypothetical protein EG340_11630 [Chryseobacterium indoltheticum]QQQ26910.1 hypothetical protein JJL46_12345 [Chryseobacterium indoltheticum]